MPRMLAGNAVRVFMVLAMSAEQPVTAFALLKQGIEHWNEWRSHNSGLICDLSGQELSQGYFFEGNFRNTNLQSANLQRACLIGADLSGADLTGADLTGAYLGDANLQGANLTHANLSKANLERADLRHTNLLGTQLTDADISTARLPSYRVDPYPDFVLTRLAQQAPSPLPNKETTVSAHELRDRKSFRAALLEKMQRLKQLSSASLDPAEVRLSAIPSKQKKSFL
ncbi:MAG: pentapeptide repeat-containing protein [Cyanobacteria bacterium P01_D01_bin.105]